MGVLKHMNWLEEILLVIITLTAVACASISTLEVLFRNFIKEEVEPFDKCMMTLAVIFMYSVFVIMTYKYIINQ